MIGPQRCPFKFEDLFMDRLEGVLLLSLRQVRLKVLASSFKLSLTRLWVAGRFKRYDLEPHASSKGLV